MRFVDIVQKCTSRLSRTWLEGVISKTKIRGSQIARERILDGIHEYQGSLTTCGAQTKASSP